MPSNCAEYLTKILKIVNEGESDFHEIAEELTASVQSLTFGIIPGTSIHYCAFKHNAPIEDEHRRAIERKYDCLSIVTLDSNQIISLVTPSIPKVAVFDLDSTLIQMEVIDELARAKPEIADQVAKITEESMAGRLDFKAALAKRVALLEGLEIEPLWQRIKETVRFTPGAKKLFTFFLSAERGWTTAIVSGGFDVIAEWVKDELGMSVAYANRLEVDSNGRLTGNLAENHEIVDSHAKRSHLLNLAQQNGATITLAVGDGANDLLMLGEADIGVAFNAKPIVQASAKFRLNHPDISILEYLLNDIQ